MEQNSEPRKDVSTLHNVFGCTMLRKDSSFIGLRREPGTKTAYCTRDQLSSRFTEIELSTFRKVFLPIVAPYSWNNTTDDGQNQSQIDNQYALCEAVASERAKLFHRFKANAPTRYPRRSKMLPIGQNYRLSSSVKGNYRPSAGEKKFNNLAQDRSQCFGNVIHVLDKDGLPTIPVRDVPWSQKCNHCGHRTIYAGDVIHPKCSRPLEPTVFASLDSAIRNANTYQILVALQKIAVSFQKNVIIIHSTGITLFFKIFALSASTTFIEGGEIENFSRIQTKPNGTYYTQVILPKHVIGFMFPGQGASDFQVSNNAEEMLQDPYLVLVDQHTGCELSFHPVKLQTSGLPIESGSLKVLGQKLTPPHFYPTEKLLNEDDMRIVNSMMHNVRMYNAFTPNASRSKNQSDKALMVKAKTIPKEYETTMDRWSLELPSYGTPLTNVKQVRMDDRLAEFFTSVPNYVSVELPATRYMIQSIIPYYNKTYRMNQDIPGVFQFSSVKGNQYALMILKPHDGEIDHLVAMVLTVYMIPGPLLPFTIIKKHPILQFEEHWKPFLMPYHKQITQIFSMKRMMSVTIIKAHKTEPMPTIMMATTLKKLRLWPRVVHTKRRIPFAYLTQGKSEQSDFQAYRDPCKAYISKLYSYESIDCDQYPCGYISALNDVFACKHLCVLPYAGFYGNEDDLKSRSFAKGWCRQHKHFAYTESGRRACCQYHRSRAKPPDIIP